MSQYALTSKEETSIRTMFFAAKEGIKTADQLAEVLYGLGEGVTEAEAHVLALEVGHDFDRQTKLGCCVSFDHFVAMMSQLKIRRLRAQADPRADTVDAFVAMGGCENRGGAVSSKTLQKVVSDFNLSIDVDRFISASPVAIATARGGPKPLTMQPSFSDASQQLVGFDIFESMLHDEGVVENGEMGYDGRMGGGDGLNTEDSTLASITNELNNALMKAPQKTPALLLSALARQSARGPSSQRQPPSQRQPNQSQQLDNPLMGLPLLRITSGGFGGALQSNRLLAALTGRTFGSGAGSVRGAAGGNAATAANGDPYGSATTHRSQTMSSRIMQALRKDNQRSGGVRGVLLRHHLRQAELQSRKPLPSEGRIYEFVRENKPYTHLRKSGTPQWILNDIKIVGNDRSTPAKGSKGRKHRSASNIILESVAATEISAPVIAPISTSDPVKVGNRAQSADPFHKPAKQDPFNHNHGLHSSRPQSAMMPSKKPECSLSSTQGLEILQRISKGVRTKCPGIPLSHDPTLAGLLARCGAPKIQRNPSITSFQRIGPLPKIITPKIMMDDKSPTTFMAERKLC